MGVVQERLEVSARVALGLRGEGLKVDRIGESNLAREGLEDLGLISSKTWS
jgi:hypothetical protein